MKFFCRAAIIFCIIYLLPIKKSIAKEESYNSKTKNIYNLEWKIKNTQKKDNNNLKWQLLGKNKKNIVKKNRKIINIK